MKARFFQFHSSPFCAKVRRILEYKGIEYETVEVDYVDRAELLRVSGQLYVPVLQLENEVLIDSTPIAMRLEELHPSPTIFPPGTRGVQLSLTRFFDEQLEDAIFKVALPDEIKHYRRQGKLQEAFFRLIRDRIYGAGFCDRIEKERAQNVQHMERELEPLEGALEGKGFLLGRIGLADFALYGQLWFLGFTGELKIPERFPNLRAFYQRLNSISAVAEV